MRIGSRVVIVGAIPIAIAAAIAIAAILLLRQVERARNGAALAGTVYRTLLIAVGERNDYLHAPAGGRAAHEAAFFAVTRRASDDLARLRALQPAQDGATRAARDTLDQYVADMRHLAAVTADNDRMADVMQTRADAVIRLTDQARERQHASNADIVRSLTDGDAKLRAARDIVDAAYKTRLAAAVLDADAAGFGVAAADAEEDNRRALFDLLNLTQGFKDLVRLIRARKDDQSDAAAAMEARLLPALDALPSAFVAGTRPDPARMRPARDLALWSEQMLKIYAAEYRSYHEEAAQLLTYSVQAHDTETATQTVALEALKIGQDAAKALAQSDEAGARTLLDRGRALSDTIAALPISPLIQSEMMEAFDTWRDGLQATTAGLGARNGLTADMDRASDAMITAARSLDATFSANAERTAGSIQDILVFGAASGLLLGGGAALRAARSITTPLVALRTRITQLAAEQHGGTVEGGHRRDELGDIARATNVFLAEIGRRERALRGAKERADAAVETLRRTQAELVQAEKLASLGQLVAGVAHEVNTPIGIALTTATVVDEEARRFRATLRDGRVSRAALDRLVERVSEGASLLGTNLARAADLVQSFKHVAADQVSGERREFEVHTFLHQLLTSLGPMLRKAGHSARMECPPDLRLDSRPGALAQVVTNLVVNASLHAFDQGEAGLVTVSAEPGPEGGVRLTVSDDGRGIAPEHRGKVFDPFFTTRRAQGSTGLGLQIVFNLVTATLGGRIELGSEPGCGTRFTVDLPGAPRPDAPLPARGEAVT